MSTSTSATIYETLESDLLLLKQFSTENKLKGYYILGITEPSYTSPVIVLHNYDVGLATHLIGVLELFLLSFKCNLILQMDTDSEDIKLIPDKGSTLQ